MQQVESYEFRQFILISTLFNNLIWFYWFVYFQYIQIGNFQQYPFLRKPGKFVMTDDSLNSILVYSAEEKKLVSNSIFGNMLFQKIKIKTLHV